MLDPLVLKLVSISFALLLLLAAVHKWTAHDAFRRNLAAYELLPRAAINPVSFAVPTVEVLLGLMWLIGVVPVVTAVASAALLASYTFAIGINVLRGRVHIDCGCGMASLAGREQSVSWGLVVRNLLLIAAALAATLPAGDRTIGAVDYVTLVAGLLAIVLLYATSNQLLSNGAAIGAWRKRRD